MAGAVCSCGAQCGVDVFESGNCSGTLGSTLAPGGACHTALWPGDAASAKLNGAVVLGGSCAAKGNAKVNGGIKATGAVTVCFQ